MSETAPTALDLLAGAMAQVAALPAAIDDLKARVAALESASTPTPTPEPTPEPTPDPTPDPVPPPTGTVPLVTPELRAAWDKMKAENHPRLAWVIGNAAQEDNSWGWAGQWNALAYQMTGDPAHAEKAWTLLNARFTSANGGMRVSDNWSREYLIEFVLMYCWLRDGLAADRRTAYLDWLNRFADTIVQNLPVGGQDGGYAIRPSDTDETIGNVLAVLAIDALPDNPRRGEFAAMTAAAKAGPLPMGGLDVSSAYDPAKGFNQATVRDDLEALAHLARGGVIPESGEYDMGTVRLWALGTQLLAALHGADHFPAHTQVVLDAARYEAARLTADRAQIAQWGDEEHPHQLVRSEYLTTLLMLAGVSAAHGRPEAPQLADLATSMLRDGEYTWSRAWAFYHPYLPRAAYQASPFVAEGQGISLVPAGNSLAVARFGPRTGADHETGDFADIQFHRDGNWCLTRPIGYGGRAVGADAANGLVIAGCFARMNERAGMTGHSVGDGYSYAAGSTGGWYYAPGTYAAPPTFLTDWSRRVLFLPGTPDVIVVWDRVDAVDPRHQGYDLTQSWYANEANAIKDMVALKEWVVHTPAAATVAGSVLTWADRAGRPARADILAPANPRIRVVDDHTLLGDSLEAAEYGFQARVAPATDTDGVDTFLVVLSFGPNPPTLTPSGSDGVLVERAGMTPIFAWFGDADPATPPPATARVLRCRPDGVAETSPTP